MRRISAVGRLRWRGLIALSVLVADNVISGDDQEHRSAGRVDMFADHETVARQPAATVICTTRPSTLVAIAISALDG